MYLIIILGGVAVAVLLLGFKKIAQAYIKYFLAVAAATAIRLDDGPLLAKLIASGLSPDAQVSHSAYEMQPNQPGGGVTTIRIKGVPWVVWSDDIYELDCCIATSGQSGRTRCDRTGLRQRDYDRRMGTGPLLIYAILLRCTGARQILLDAGADVNAVDCYGQTALMMAAWQGDAATVRSLLAKGADLKMRDRSGRTARDWAKAQGCRKVMALLDSY